MDWESFGVVGFDLGPCLQGQTRIAKLKSAYNSLIMVLEVWDGKPTYRNSWSGNVFVWLDLTLDPLFKIERGYGHSTLVSHFGPVLIYKELDHPMAGICNTYICPL